MTRAKVRQAAEKLGDAHGAYTAVFTGSNNPRTATSVKKISDAAERLRASEELVVSALSDLGEYIAFVRGDGSGDSTPSRGTGNGTPEPVPTPDDPAPFHRRHFDALPTRTKDDDPADAVLTTIRGVTIEAVASGQRGPGQGGPGLKPPYSQMWTVLNHAEGHAAALMRTRKIQHTTLYINNEPCDTSPYGCARVLPRIMRKGSTMTVYGPNGYVRVYTGTGEGLTT